MKTFEDISPSLNLRVDSKSTIPPLNNEKKKAMEQLAFKFIEEYEKDKIKQDLLKQINKNNVDINNSICRVDYLRDKNEELNKKLYNL